MTEKVLSKRPSRGILLQGNGHSNWAASVKWIKKPGLIHTKVSV